MASGSAPAAAPYFRPKQAGFLANRDPDGGAGGHNYRSRLWVDTNPKNGEVTLRCVATDIVRIRPNGEIVLTTGGFFTATTLNCMNDMLLPIDCYITHSGRVVAGNWTVHDNHGNAHAYSDGVVIPAPDARDAQRGRVAMAALQRELRLGGINWATGRGRQEPGKLPPAPAAPPPPPAPRVAPAAAAPRPAAASASGGGAGAGAWSSGAPASAVLLQAQALWNQKQAQAAAAAARAGRGGRPRKTVEQQLAEQSAALDRHARHDGHEDDILCVVCLELLRDAVLIPCGHTVLCHGCCKDIIKSLGECPVCREGILDDVQIAED